MIKTWMDIPKQYSDKYSRKDLTKIFFWIFSLFLACVILPLSLISITILTTIYDWIRKDVVYRHDTALVQVAETINSVLEEGKMLNANFAMNNKINKTLRDLLDEDVVLDYNNLDQLSILRSFLDSPVYYRKYYYSIYIYLDGYRHFLSSEFGIRSIETATDTEWLDNIGLLKNTAIYIESRTINQRDMIPISVITLYNPLYSYDFTHIDGAVILNIQTDYLNNLMQNMAVLPGQQYLIVNGNRQVILNQPQDTVLPSASLEELLKHTESDFNMNLDGNSYYVSQIDSPEYNLKYISITPVREIYRLPLQVQKYLVFALGFSILLGVMLALALTYFSSSQIFDVIRLVAAAESGKPLPRLHSKTFLQNSYIIQSILSTFIDNQQFKIRIREDEYQKKIFELTALQAQINPHFVMNTLETINWKIIRAAGAPTPANDMIAELSNVLNYSLKNPMACVSLEEEIYITKCYVSLLEKRLCRLFVLDWKVSPNIYHFQIIKLVLQPLIENCITHGFRNRTNGGRIRIRIHQWENYLYIRIFDNGTGIPAEKLKAIRSRISHQEYFTESIGLFNTCRRIQLFYGHSSGIAITSRPGRGTLIKLRIPVNPETPAISPP